MINLQKKDYKYMKKNYIAPAITELTLATEAMVATSVIIDGSGNTTIDTEDPGAQLGGGRRGEWGNLWK